MDYVAYGLRIRSSFALPFPAAPAPDGENRAADVTVGGGATPPRLPNPTMQRRLDEVAWEAAPGAFLMKLDNVARCLVTDGCRILVEPLGGGERKLGAFLVGSPFAALLQQRGLTTLHAGAVKAEAGAALFAGFKGAGKSTLLGALVERGCALLSDAFTGIEAKAGGRFLALPGAVRLLPAARLCTEPTAVRAVYVLETHQGAEIEVRPASWTRAREALLQHTYRPRFLHVFGRQPAHLRIVHEMAAQTPVFEVRRPASPFQLDALVERIAAHLESDAAAHPPPIPPDNAAKGTDPWGSTRAAAVSRHRKMIDALGGRGGLFKRAEAALRRKLAANPHDAEALLRLGDLLRGKGRLDAAQDAYRRVAELRPGHPKASRLCAVLGGADLPAAPQAPDALPAPFVRVRSFLPPDEHAALLSKVLAGREHFSEPAMVGPGYAPDPSVRNNSEADRQFAAKVQLAFEPRLRKLVEGALPRLGMGGFGAYSLDGLQVRTYQDGEFYAAHNDFDHGDLRPREINYVYYLHRRPKSFSGGHLLLHDHWLAHLMTLRRPKSFSGGRLLPYDGAEVYTFTRLEPEDNSIVLFPSRCVHEVTTVECDPDDFGAGRFSLNGALRKLRADGC